MSDSSDQHKKWNARYACVESQASPQPAAVLRENQHLLPNVLTKRGVALDLACGLGGNALYLAQQGFEAHAWDVSGVAIDRLNSLAETLGISVYAAVRDVVRQPPAAHAYDVIVVSRFLQRSLIPKIIAALKPGGLVFYQTFILDKPVGIGPTNPDFLLADNELLRLFSKLRILVYREEGQVGDVSQGFRHEAMLVGQKITTTGTAVPVG